VTIGDCLPSHAFTREGLLLLAQGERIINQAQLDRLLREDVILSDDPPPRIKEAIAERYRSLGMAPPRASESAPAPPAGAALQPRPGEPAVIDGPPAARLSQELPRAREVRKVALQQVRRLFDDVQAGRPLELAPARHTVSHILDSLRRSPHALASLLSLKKADEYTFTHSVNTCILAVMVAEQCGLSPDVEEVGLGALVHDVGKLQVPVDVLNKAGRLSDEEWQLIRRHPESGLDMLSHTLELHGPVLEAVSQHHERTDGTGYPAGLQGEAIGVTARLVALADVYDAMTSDRPYHAAAQPADAVRYLLQNAGRHFDLETDRAFVRAVGIYPVGSLVRLNTGELCVVASVNASTLRRPTVLVISTPWGAALPVPETLDLAEPFIAATKREIVAVEDPARFGIAVDSCLSAASVSAGRELPRLDSRA
jgi:HD-GYP domain-containing protein (c-di-GMP phosphodiesterase class II)